MPRHSLTRLSRHTFFFAIVLVLVACGGGGGDSSNTPTSSSGSVSVTSTVPAFGASNVFAGTVISATFDKSINPSSISASTFIVSHLPGGPISGSYAYDAATRTASFTPASPLAFGAAYAALLTGVRGAAGESLADFGWSFFVQSAPDAVPPVTTASPVGGIYNVAQTVQLTCTDTGTGCAATYYTVNGSTPTTASTLYTGPISIATTTVLKFFSVDFEGNAETVKQQSYTIDTVPPTASALEPTSDQTNVKLNTVIRAQFSEAMNPATVNTGTMQVDNGVTGTVSYDAGTNVATFTPADRLACNTLHTVTIGTGPQDLAANGLAAPFNWSFTTFNDCTEPVTTPTSTGGVFTGAQNVTLNCADTGSGCARIVYTTDGSAPSFAPANGTIVAGATAGPIAIGVGDTRVRFFAEDNAGNRETVREISFSISTTGFTYVATDGGLGRGVGPTPTQFVNIASAGSVNEIFPDTAAQRLYRGTSKGIQFSDDNGASWVQMAGLSGNVSGLYANGSRIYAAANFTDLRISTDGGVSFVTRTNADGLGFTPSRVAVSGRHVYVATSSGLAISDNKGASFTLRTTANGLGSNQVNDVIVDGNTLYVATGGGVSISTDGGASFINKTTANGLGSNSASRLALNGGVLYAATTGGLGISSDGGATFSNRTTSQGLARNEVASVAASGVNVYVATGVSFSSAPYEFAASTSGGASFTSFAGSGAHINDIHVDASGKVYAADTRGLATSTNGGATFAFGELTADPLKDVRVANGRLYVTTNSGTGGPALGISTDFGRSFAMRSQSDGLGFSRIDDLFVSGSSVYAATFGGLSISTNDGASFVTKTTANGLFVNAIDSVFVSGTNIYVSPSNAVQRSTDLTGNTFNAPLTTLNSGIGRATVVSGTNIYVAASNGLWVSGNSGSTWAQRTTANGLGSNNLNDVAVSGTTVYAGGLNTGLYVSTDSGASFGPTGFTTSSVNSVRLSGANLYIGTPVGMGISSDGGASFSFRTSSSGLGSNVVRDVFFDG